MLIEIGIGSSHRHQTVFERLVAPGQWIRLSPERIDTRIANILEVDECGYFTSTTCIGGPWSMRVCRGCGLETVCHIQTWHRSRYRRAILAFLHHGTPWTISNFSGPLRAARVTGLKRSLPSPLSRYAFTMRRACLSRTITAISGQSCREKCDARPGCAGLTSASLSR